jgi:hypothetical protein
VTGVAEQVRRPLLDQVVDDEVTASHLGHGYLLRGTRGPYVRRMRGPCPNLGHRGASRLLPYGTQT